MSCGKDLLLLVWVHGFKGNEVTFESFPDRIKHLLETTHPSLKIVSKVFPAYQTRGELNAATLAFVDWLTSLVVELENDHGAGGGAGKARIVLMGHSMGGLLIADAARDIVANTRPGAPLWPQIIGVMAFDTPYLGLHPHTFKHGLSTAAGYYEQAKNIASAAGMLSPLAIGLGVGKWGKREDSTETGPTRAQTSAGTSKTTSTDTSIPQSASSTEPTKSSNWTIPRIPTPSTKALYGLGAVALGAAAAGTAYYRREDFLTGWKWGYEHMTFVKNLWDGEAMTKRLDDLYNLDTEHGVRFWNFYTYLPASQPKHLTSRTFIILPSTSHPLYPRFRPASNSLASDEVSAHMGMFNAKTNDGFYDLGLEVMRGMGERVEEAGVGTKTHTACWGVSEELEEALTKEYPSEKDALGNGWRVEDQDGKVVWVDE
ncbi:hypothetical protein BD324DRAFT_651349 [Kockovaella imperatae]|uniref:DUF676 domain-containing protein n=1 Tax=Kockovaella imperatae TaxID=4999 RepID=A0A1Y1UFT0_9TREE|nr:hypothetical protein BD324DRAFT_651349 [Kockovaella imperatae]ORX36872.1 hypothetical protein BD324DRAFT_651349 [Kockovaella imperatae]